MQIDGGAWGHLQGYLRRSPHEVRIEVPSGGTPKRNSVPRRVDQRHAGEYLAGRGGLGPNLRGALGGAATERQNRRDPWDVWPFPLGCDDQRSYHDATNQSRTKVHLGSFCGTSSTGFYDHNHPVSVSVSVTTTARQNPLVTQTAPVTTTGTPGLPQPPHMQPQPALPQSPPTQPRVFKPQMEARFDSRSEGMDISWWLWNSSSTGGAISLPMKQR